MNSSTSSTIAGLALLALIIGAILVLSALAHPSPAPAAPQPAPTVLEQVAPRPAPTPVPDPFSFPRWAAANGALIAWLVAVGLLPFAGYIGIAIHARHRSRLIELDHPPLKDRESIRAAYEWKNTEAGAQAGTLQTLTYAPKWSNRVDAGAAIAQPALVMPPPATLTVAELLTLPGVLYGIARSDGRQLTDPRPLSLGIGGQPGSGKSTTAAVLARQHHHRGGRVLIGDPNGGHPESLLGRLGGFERELAPEDVAVTDAEILALVDRAHGLMRQRAGLWRLGQGPTQPVVVIVDEWTSLLRRRELAGELLSKLEDIGQQGRKYGVAAILIAQAWSAEAVGSSQLRNPLPGAYVHRMRPEEARMLTGRNLPDVLDLEQGEAFVVGLNSAPERVWVPRLEGVALDVQATSTRLPDGFRSDFPLPAPEVSGKSAGSLLQVVPDARDLEIAELFEAGKDIAEIVRGVFGVDSSGRRYQQASREVQAALRRVRQARS